MSSPIVTGMSPIEGPPGTRVIIRGEQLGIGPQDLIGLTICGTDCLLSAEWVTQNKIVARAGPTKGRGDIIVTTKSGGRGTCTIQFNCLIESINPLKEVAVWHDESQLIKTYGRKRAIVQHTLHQDNPLGLADEGNKRYPEAKLQDMFPEGSGNLSSENFIPVWFLVENHSATTFDDLKAGLNCLKRKVSSQKEGELSFLKANVGAVLDQLETLSSLQDSIVQDKAVVPISTDKMERAIIKSKEEADKLFKDVLGRRERADATRNGLGVLQRFKFLFNLPRNIERNIQKGDYDVVINDYARAKSLFADTEVQIFRKVYQEVEQRIANFQTLLLDRLHDLPMNLDTQKLLIKYLVNLETPGDPGWDCIIIQRDYIVQLLRSCNNAYLDKDQAFYEGSVMQTSQTKGFGGNKLAAPTPRLGRSDRRGSSFVGNDYWQDRPPYRILFVEELCSLTIQELSNLWKLGQSYLSGDLHSKEIIGSGVKLHVEAEKSATFNQIIIDVMQLFCQYVQDAVLNEKQQLGWPDASKDASKLWLPQCIQEMRNFYSDVNKLKLPLDVNRLVQQLLFDLRVACLRSMFARAFEEVKSLHNVETWNIEVMEPEYGSITQLPHFYENAILKTIQLVREGVLQVGPQEIALLGNAATEVEMINHWRDLILGFPHMLRVLAESLTSVPSSHVGNANNSKASPFNVKVSPEMAGGPTAKNSAIDSTKDENTENYSPEKLLLVILGNCNFTKDHVLPRLMDSFAKHGFPKADSIAEEAVEQYNDLDNFLFNTYIDLKCDPIIGVIEQRMYAGYFDWATCPRLFGIRSYIKEILVSIITVHCEIYSVAPSVVARAMRKMIESVCEEISRLFSCITKYSLAGNLQARADLRSLHLAFGDYLTKSAKNSLKEALDSLTPINSAEDNKTLEDQLNIFQRRMKIHLMCFKVEGIAT